MKMSILSLFFVLSFLTSCGNQQKSLSDCDELDSSGGPYDSKRYDCPSGDPDNADVDFGAESFSLGEIEAGSDFIRMFTVSNKGKAKIFDFNIITDGAEQITNSCQGRLNPGQTCYFQIKITENIAQKQKEIGLKISDRTGRLNKKVPVFFDVIPSYPEEVKMTFFDTDFKTKKIVFGPLKDRFNNLIVDTNWNVQTNRKISEFNTAPFQSNSIIKSSDSSGNVEVFVKTDKLEALQEVDSAELSFGSSKIYANGISILRQYSVTFLNNRPILDGRIQEYNILEDSVKNHLSLIRAVDSQKRPLTYKIINQPTNGVLSNCLIDENFVTLVTCEYTPNPNFFGADSFTYIASNGASTSFNTAIVNILVQNVNDAPILSGQKNVSVISKQSNTVTLHQAYDPDGDVLSYEIVSMPTKGSITCNGVVCSYTPNINQNTTDFFTYRARDPYGLYSQIFTINLKINKVNEAPNLGGSLIVNTLEDTVVNFTLLTGIDPDGDVLTYKIKTPVAKGILENCLISGSDLNCKYTPNKNVDSADSFSYVAVDPSGKESEPKIVTIQILQVNDAPEFLAHYQEVTTTQNTMVSFILLSAIDPEGNSISYTFVNPPTQGILENCLVTATNLTCRYTPPPEVNNSSVSFSYKATDNQGAVSETVHVKIIIKSGNELPTKPADMNLSVNEDEVLDFALNKSTDTETPQEFLRYRIINQPTNGSLTSCLNLVGSTGLYDLNCKYKPYENFNGVDSFTYIALDGLSNESLPATVSITVNNTNDAPHFEEAELSFETNEDEILSLTINPAIDPDGDVISYSIKTSPSNGTLLGCHTSIGIADSCKYTPSLNYNGEDFFIIKAEDSSGSSGDLKVKIKINPVNDAPTLETMQVVTVYEDTLKTITVLPATDVDTQASNLRYELVSPPTKGKLSSCLSINDFQGFNCSYMPLSNTSGADSFSYRAYDGELYSEPVVVSMNIVPVNNVPFFEKSQIGPFRVEKGVSFSFEVELARDLENDPITYQIITQPTKGDITSCFSGNPKVCTYTPDENASGIDNFVYKARDNINDSYNNVQVNFIIDDKRTERIVKTTLSGAQNPAQKQSSSTDKNVYALGHNLFFNASIESNGYLNNVLMKKNSLGQISQVGNASLRFKSIVNDNKLYVFDELGDKKYLKIYKEDGSINSIEYQVPSSLVYPTFYNSNIYVGSSSSALYKVNLININDKNISFVESVADKSKLGISTNNGVVETIGVYKNELFFTFTGNGGIKNLAKLDFKDNIKNISENSIISGVKYLSEFFYFKNESGNVNKLYFFAGADFEDKKLYFLDLNKTEDQVVEIVTSGASLQSNITNPIIYESIDGTSIIFKNNITNKLIGLEPHSDVLIEYPIEDVKNYSVSNDKSKIVVVKNDGSIFVSNYALQSPLEKVEGITADWSIGLELDRMIIKEKDKNNLYAINSLNSFSSVSLPSNFIVENNFHKTKDGRIFVYSPRSSISGLVYDLHEFKSNVSYSIEKGKNNLIETLISGSNATYSLVPGEEPRFGQLTDCFGLGSSTTQDNTCLYLPEEGYLGVDSFKYRITESGISKDVVVSLDIKNQKPYYDNYIDFFEFTKIQNLGGSIESYTMQNDELYLVVNKNENKVLYRHNSAEGLREITRNISGYGSLRTNNNYLFYVDKDFPQKIIQYDITSKTTQVVFRDTEVASSLQVRDLVLVNNDLYAILKDYGFPPLNRMAKINLNTFEYNLIPLLVGYENGYFIKNDENFFIETNTQFSYFNKASNTFVDTKNFSDQILSGKTQVLDNKTLVFNTQKMVGNDIESNIVYYDIENKKIIKEKKTSHSGYVYTNMAFYKHNAGSTPLMFIDLAATDGSKSLIEIISNATSDFSDENLFEETHSHLEQIKNFNGDFVYIARNSNWSEVVFKRIGKVQVNNVLNASETNFKIKPIRDLDGDNLSYEMVDYPNFGEIRDCIGLNSSSMTDFNCVYKHTDTVNNSVIDSFSYRAYDGYEYSEEVVINFYIKNSAPVFVNNNTISLTTPINVPVDFTIPNAIDPDGNIVYYIITQNPTIGTVSGCINSVVDLANSSRNCSYISSGVGSDTFKVSAYDGVSFSSEITITIEVNNNPNPVFPSSGQTEYISKSDNTYKIYLERALDPNGLPLSYTIVQQPSHGIITNCFAFEATKMVCTYIPNDPNVKISDSFTYVASNGNLSSPPRTVNIEITNSFMNGILGDFKLTEDGPILLKNNLNNIQTLKNLFGYNWNPLTKTLTLPANREYQFKSFELKEGVILKFTPFSETSVSSLHGWTQVYSQSNCRINGVIRAVGGQTNNGTAQAFSASSVDGDSLLFNLPAYLEGKLGGTGGGSSLATKYPDFYYGGLASIFKGGNGELGLGQIGTETKGGLRGKDGLSIFFKCLNSFEGTGVVDSSGENGQDGEDGLPGLEDNNNMVSFGGNGGAAGGNGGHAGIIRIKSKDFDFNGEFKFFGGSGGQHGIGGEPSFMYSGPYSATHGIDGEDGASGINANCGYSTITGSYGLCN